MIKYKKRKIIFEAMDKFICDKCKKIIKVSEDQFELQETHSIDFIGGYSSVFGDGIHISCDLCQNCLHDLIKDFCISDFKVV